MKLIVNGVEYDCVSAAKTADSVEIADESGNVTTFSGIKNMEDYVLEGGEWNTPEPLTEEILLELAADHEERLCMMELGI